MSLMRRKSYANVRLNNCCRSHDSPFNFVRGANSNGHRLLQYEKTKNAMIPMDPDSKI